MIYYAFAAVKTLVEQFGIPITTNQWQRITSFYFAVTTLKQDESFDLEEIGIIGILRDQQTQLRAQVCDSCLADEVRFWFIAKSTKKPNLFFSCTFFGVMPLLFHLTYIRQKSCDDR